MFNPRTHGWNARRTQRRSQRLSTIAHTSQRDVLELMYYIQQRKILMKYTFFQEQCLVFSRDDVFMWR
jgi:hypothetical protein